MRRSFVASLVTLVLIGCSGAAEQPIVNQLFTASRLHDSTTLAGFSMVELDPQKEGSVLSFSITNVSPETRKPLQLRSLAKAYEDARAEDAALNKQSNVTPVATAGREATLRDVSRKVFDAKRKFANESAVAAISVADPRNPVDLTKVDGELVSKEVTVDADLRLPSGQSTKKTYTLTLQRALLKGPKGDINGRWVITDLR